MKQIISFTVAGIIGGLVVIAGLKFTESPTIIESNAAAQVIKASNIINTGVNTDFVHASAVATDAVVHINAQESRTLAMQRQEESRRNRRGSAFDNFFGGGDFFGNNFHRPKSGSGSGVIISSDGYIVTNNHVVGFADVINVTLNDGRVMKATKIGTDPSTDLAVIKIESVSESFPKLEYADSDQVQVGEWVLAVGSPFGYLKSTVTAGIISAIGRDLDIIEGEKTIEEFIQTDAVVNPGNSGGALVNDQGKLVGINSAIATPTGVYAGYSFAIPSNLAKVIIKDIIENGDIERVNLGIEGYDVKDIKEDFNLSENNGFYVEDVYIGSAAQFGGLLPGDIIKKVNGERINELEDIKRVMKFNKVGDTVKLDVVRNGTKKTIRLKLSKSM